MILQRKLKLKDAQEDSVFLWGARQTGKSTLLKMLFPDAQYYDLLKADEFARLSRQPSLLREELHFAESNALIIIDEVQKIPALLDEVHWLIENKKLRFILSGSSARKLKRVGANLLGGRAVRNVLHPLVSAEIPDFDIIKACNNGLIPRHYLVDNPYKRLQAYVGDYLHEEIALEAQLRNISSFTRFLEVAAMSDGEMINFTNIASDCGVSSPTIKEYFTILEDTMIGYFIPAFQKVKKRRLIKAPRFYYFDVGVSNYLLGRQNLQPGTVEFGHAFEHVVIQELVAYLNYEEKREQLSYWRTSTGLEVDAILGEAQVAIEIKSSQEIQSRHLKGLKAFNEEHPDARLIIVCLEERPRLMQEKVEVLPVKYFFNKLWDGGII